MAETKTRSPRSTAPKGAPKGKEGAAGAEAKAPRSKESSAAGSEPGHVCNVAFCPIGLALSTVQGAAPEVLEHLLKAAQEFFLAARAVMDNRAADFEETPEKATIERIEIS
jgi:hypothetical protein